MTKPTKLEKRKLNTRHRLMMTRFALETFVEPDLRAAHVEAGQAMIQHIETTIDSIPASEMKVLRRHKLTTHIDGVFLGLTLQVKDGTKTFTKPNGDVVEREKTKTLAFVPINPTPPAVDNSSAIQQISKNGVGALMGWWRSHRDFRFMHFSKPREVPRFKSGVVNRWNADSDVSARFMVLSENSDSAPVWLDGAGPAVEAFYRSGDALMQAEGALVQAIARVILAAETYGDVLTVWPEARAIETDLFGAVGNGNNALVALSNEDRAILCNNMGRRGITSAACEMAKVPGHDESTAAAVSEAA
jgi:hypothetical protein